MSVQAQEDLFNRLLATHPGWTTKFISGYVAGVQDEGLRKTPQAGYIGRAKLRENYALGYLTGFALSRGADAAFEKWFSLVDLLVEEARNAQDEPT
jgi:hypothetical protein